MSPYHATLWRHHESADGTWGALVADGFAALTLELPWRENLPNVSCIPFGRYPCVWCYSNTFEKYHYLLEDVPNRKGVRIHSANRIGQLRGCIALGRSLHRPIENSGPYILYDSAVDEFEQHFGHRSFVLEITWEHPFYYTGKYWKSLVPPDLVRTLEIHEYAMGGVRSEELCGPETIANVSPVSDNS